MYIDRIRIDWDKVNGDSYLTRIPAIGLLQELAFRPLRYILCYKDEKTTMFANFLKMEI